MSGARTSGRVSGAKLALAVKRLRAESPQSALLLSEPIAIIGMGCRFPGGANSPDAYWDMLVHGVDAIREAPASRWNADEWFDIDPQAAGKTNSRWGSFLDNADQFDPAFFGISPREAASIDPQQRLLLEVAWESLWDAGLPPDAMSGSQTGVFVAVYNSDYSRLLFADPASIGPHTSAGAAHSIASGRISFLLDLRGPSVSIDTACSSSLVAIHLACQSLRFGECRVALAGGATLHLSPEHYVAMAKLGMLSPDGRCKTFDARANGFVPGEGCGIIVLKRLADALADGDRIHAVIRGTATTQDGRTSVLTAPNGLAQQAVIRAALENGQVEAEQITYVETHGTGTALGDPIEVEALTEVLGGQVQCALGAVKSNMGHLEAAAGVAGVIKAVLALEHEAIPPNLHFETVNPLIALDETRFFVPTEMRAWPRGADGRFAGVSSFGFGGTNAHVVLEEAPRVPVGSDPAPTSGVYLLPISARSPEAVAAFARRYQEVLSADAPIAAVCRAAAVRRSHYEERSAVTGATADELRAGLQDVLDGRPRLGASRGRVRDDRGVVFVCSGQGSQWARMGVSLLGEPVFRAAVEECDSVIRALAGWSVLEEFEADQTTSRLAHTEYAQPAIVVIEIALARLWESWGIVPSAVIGHSVGEIAAACIAGALDVNEAMRVVLHRGRLMERATGTGRMAAVFLSAAEVEREIARESEMTTSAVSLAAVNSPRSSVISGETASVEAMIAAWQARGVGCKALPVDYAFHSAQMEPFRDELTRVLGTVAARRTIIPMISTVTGDVIAGTELDAAYWGRNVRQPVLFGTATQEALEMGFTTFVEIGAHPVLATAVQECMADSATGEAGTEPQGVVIPSLRRNLDERTMLFASLGTLYTRGADIHWKAVYPGVAPVVTLPSYPYQRQRYWVKPVKTRGGELRVRRPLLGTRLRSPLLPGVGFETQLSVEMFPFLADHRIGDVAILPMAAFLEIVIEAVAETTRTERVVLHDIVVQQPLVVPETDARVVHVLLEESQFRVFSLDGEQWVLHAIGRFGHGESAAVTPANGFGAEALPTTALAVDVRDHYQRAWERGAQFGPAFQTVTHLSVAGNVAAATAQLTSLEDGSAAQYEIHPALLDGCFQTALAVEGTESGPVWVPIAIDRVEMYGRAGSQVCSTLKVRSDVKTAEKNETAAADVWISDPTGRPVAMVTGLRLRRMPVAERDSTARFRYHVRWQMQPRGEPVREREHQNQSASAKGWLIVGDANETSGAVRQAFEQRGEVCTVTPIGSRDTSLDLAGYRGVVLLIKNEPSNTDDVNASVERTCQTTLSLIQSIARQADGPDAVWIITRGAQLVRPEDKVPAFAHASVLGLARTIALEFPELTCATIDIEAVISSATSREDSVAPATIAALAEEILHSDGEDQIAFRGSERYVPRLTPEPTSSALLTERRLAIPVRGTLDNLRFEPLERRAPGVNEVEVLVEAAALNFRDVLNALDMYPGQAGPLGLEFAGRIARVGDGVSSWHPGDRVMGIAWGSFANYVVTPAVLITAIPSHLDTESAATLPNAFLTAHHCLIQTARMQAGDRVLIHAGAGGVGMAAIQLALDAGAEVFTTAGSEEKRAYLRSLGVHHVFDSRTIDFSQQILEVTDGRGVDVVLNSLSGEFIGASFAAMAPHGRFVEIGKIGVWTEQQVAALGKHIAYSVIDLGPVIEATPELIHEQLDHIRELAIDKRITPLPYRTFPFDEAETAFRYMAQARHIGRIVLRIAASAIVRTDDATYLITGGLGDLGLRVARWLVDQGARYLVLVGRSAPTPQVRDTLDELRSTGVTIDVQTADVTQRTHVADMLQTITQSMPPLRGIIHAAGVLDDGMLLQQTWDRFANVLAPKVLGAWNLHELTHDIPLDFFVCFSSAAAVLGSPGQGAYAAGNAFLDALAAHRRTTGRPALSINWGAWDDIGMAARVEARGQQRTLEVIRPMSPEDCLACLEQAIPSPDAHVVIIDANWSAWRGKTPSVLMNLVRSASHVSSSAASANTNAIAQQLADAPPASRRGLLTNFVRQEARRVLGLSENHPIDERQPLLKLGLDSLMAVELRNRLATALNRALPATLLFDYPSPAELASFILGAAESADTSTTASQDRVLHDIASLSDEEAERLLALELGQDE